MRASGLWIGAIVLGFGALASAQITPVAQSLIKVPTSISTSALDIATDATDGSGGDVPLLVVTAAEPPTVYAPPEPEHVEDGVNKGGVNLDLDLRYLTDDVYRGISHNRAVYRDPKTGDIIGKLHAANFQVDGQMSFNFGKFPHPFVGVFTNINDSDPQSRFQEIRPYFGLEYTIRPLMFRGGVNAYLYPERERINPSPNTAEVFLKLTLDDSYFFLTPKPILSPYVYGAYDYQRNRGWYLEAGLKHDFDFDDFGFTLTPRADVAYVSRYFAQFVTSSPESSGFQHYDLGLTATYALNPLLHLGPRYGQFSLEGYLTYTGKFSNAITADSEVWGGVGLKFKY